LELEIRRRWMYIVMGLEMSLKKVPEEAHIHKAE
jgi:hypothetical protein